MDTVEEFPGFGGHGTLRPGQVYVQFCLTDEQEGWVGIDQRFAVAS